MIESIEEALGVEPLAGEGLMMNWDQVRALCRSGHIVGSHTLTHPNLAQITEAEAEHESARIPADPRIPAWERGCPLLLSQSDPHTSLVSQDFRDRRAGRLPDGGDDRTGLCVGADQPMSLRRVAAPQDGEGLNWALDCTLIGHQV